LYLYKLNYLFNQNLVLALVVTFAFLNKNFVEIKEYYMEKVCGVKKKKYMYKMFHSEKFRTGNSMLK